MASRRRPESLRAALEDDARSRAYRFVWLPMLLVQLVLYTRVVVRFLAAPVYRSAGTEALPLLRENHIGNLVSLRSQPSLPLLSVHVLMAWAWIAVVLLQKLLVARMARAAAAPDPDPEKTAVFQTARTIHAAAGTGMVVLGVIGVLAGPVIALVSHGNPGMKWFLVAQPLFFVPAMGMTVVTARDARRSIRHHRFWADTAFLGPAVASVWTEAGIYVLGRMTPLGPNSGELIASVVGGGLGALAVVVPGWLARRRGLEADARGAVEPAPEPEAVPAAARAA